MPFGTLIMPQFFMDILLLREISKLNSPWCFKVGERLQELLWKSRWGLTSNKRRKSVSIVEVRLGAQQSIKYSVQDHELLSCFSWICQSFLTQISTGDLLFGGIRKCCISFRLLMGDTLEAVDLPILHPWKKPRMIHRTYHSRKNERSHTVSISFAWGLLFAIHVVIRAPGISENLQLITTKITFSELVALTF